MAFTAATHRTHTLPEVQPSASNKWAAPVALNNHAAASLTKNNEAWHHDARINQHAGQGFLKTTLGRSSSDAMHCQLISAI